MGATTPDGEEAMLMVKENPSQSVRSNFASTRNLRAGSTSLVLSLAVVICMIVWPRPLVAAEAADPCQILDDRLVSIGKGTDSYKEDAAADKDRKIIRFAVN